MAQFPKFKLENQNGDIVTNEDLTSQTVIYFYPKDNTPGCTTQACDIRDNSKESDQKFIEKKDLNFDLLVDENNELAAEAGVIGDKNVFGKKVRGIVRTTFIVDENNEILKRFDKVSPKKHVEQVLEFLKEG